MWISTNDGTLLLYFTYLLTFLLSILLTGCFRKARPPPPPSIKPSSVQSTPIPEEPPNYDETQENVQTVELQEDHMSNVRLLTPVLQGGCTDENAAKEAANRHKSNQYFPRLELQKTRIVNDTPSEELQKLLNSLPPHPPPRYREALKEPSVHERVAKWKDVHVSWHEVGIVFLVRSRDSCRSKDDAVADTVDSQKVDETEESKINSEMPLSDKNKNATPGAKSKKSGKSEMMAGTQDETIDKSKLIDKTPVAPTVKPTQSMKSVNL